MGCSSSHARIENATDTSTSSKNSRNTFRHKKKERTKDENIGKEKNDYPHFKIESAPNTSVQALNRDNKQVKDVFMCDSSGENFEEEEEPPTLTIEDILSNQTSDIGSTISDLSSGSYDDEDLELASIDLIKNCGYKYIKTLGRGATATVIEMLKDGKRYAVKVCDVKSISGKFYRTTNAALVENDNNKCNNNINNQRKKLKDPKDEVYLMKKFDHPNVIKFFEFYEDEDQNKLYIVMELATGGNITNCSSMQQKKIAFAQSVSALQYIHYQRIAHKDIKADNILRSSVDGSIKISDFGLSELVPEGKKKIDIEMKGTPAYSPPEIFGDQPYDPFAADVWSLGVTFYFVLFGELPFVAKNLKEIRDKVTKDELKFPHGTEKDIVDLLSKMMAKDPEKRINLADIWKNKWMKGTIEEIEKPNEVLIQSSDLLYKSLTPGNRKNSIKKITNSTFDKLSNAANR